MLKNAVDHSKTMANTNNFSHQDLSDATAKVKGLGCDLFVNRENIAQNNAPEGQKAAELMKQWEGKCSLCPVCCVPICLKEDSNVFSLSLLS